MRRFSNIIVCTLALAFCLAALPVVSTAEEVNFDSHGRVVTTVHPAATGPSPNALPLGTPIPEGTTIVYSNFGAGDSYNCCTGWTEGGTFSYLPVIQAMAFTPAKATYILKQLDVALVYDEIGTDGMTVELRGDNYGAPGKVIDSWYMPGLPVFGTTSNGVQTIPVNKTIVLVQNRQYWLVPVANSNEAAAWPWNTMSASGNGAISRDGGETWSELVYSPNGAFDVLGTVLPQTSGQ